MPRRIAAPQLLYDFRIGEPGWNVAALVQALAQFRARNIEHLGALWHFVGRHVTVLVLQIHHHLEGNHGNAHFLLVLLEQFLGFIRTVKRLAVGILPRSGMISPDDEMSATVVLADESVPHRFPRSAHAHGQRQHRQLDRPVRVFREQQLVAARADEVIHIARLRHSDGRMNQQVRLDLFRGTHGQFNVCAVHGVAGLEGNRAGPSQAAEFCPDIRRSEAQRAKVVV